MNIFIRIFLVSIACVVSFSTFAIEGESIIFNPATGNYLITYLDSNDNNFHQVTFIPATKINPTIKVKFVLDHDGNIHYGYTMINGVGSKQEIVHFILDPVSSVTTPLPNIPLNATSGTTATDMSKVASYFDTPLHWHASIAYSDSRVSFIIGWYYIPDTGGIVPGGKANFGFKSRDLPGIIQANVYGFAPDSQEIPGEETQDAQDGGFGQQYESLIVNNFINRFAATPTITVPTPFNATVLLGSIQTQMHTWIGMQLLDATFSAQLDRYLTAAADAYRHNQPKVVKDDIEKIREMLKREHQDLGRDEEHESDKNQEKNDNKKTRMIDHLAAQVLDFDLKYVLKRMGGDKDD